MKSYKLNKIFENSIFPIERQLAELNNSTKKNILDIVVNFFAVFFSGIGTSILFQQNVFPKFLKSLLCKFLEDKTDIDIVYAVLEILLIVIIFILLYVVGKQLFKGESMKHKLLKKKNTDEGRKELLEYFHKSVINNIVMGTSFLSKVTEKNDGSEEEKQLPATEMMYLCEAVYYYSLAEKDIEYLNLFDSEMEEKSVNLIKMIGIRTLFYTIQVFSEGVNELQECLPECLEKRRTEQISRNLTNYDRILKKIISDNCSS